MTYKKYREITLLFLISTFIIIFLAYITFNILDIFNPVIIEEDRSILITPGIHKLLMVLEQKYK